MIVHDGRRRGLGGGECGRHINLFISVAAVGLLGRKVFHNQIHARIAPRGSFSIYKNQEK